MAGRKGSAVRTDDRCSDIVLRPCFLVLRSLPAMANRFVDGQAEQPPVLFASGSGVVIPLSPASPFRGFSGWMAGARLILAFAISRRLMLRYNRRFSARAASRELRIGGNV